MEINEVKYISKYVFKHTINYLPDEGKETIKTLFDVSEYKLMIEMLIDLLEEDILYLKEKSPNVLNNMLILGRYYKVDYNYLKWIEI